jgi:dihydrofolate reductase
MSAISAKFFDEGVGRVGAVIAGRRTYDVSEAWGGSGPMPGIPLFVVTHRIREAVPTGDPPYTFVTEGIERAIEQARTAAAGRDVALMGASIVQQALRAGLLDELIINLVPVVLGRGVRLLDGLDPETVEVDLVGVVDAPGVTHLTYRVVKEPTLFRYRSRSTCRRFRYSSSSISPRAYRSARAAVADSPGSRLSERRRNRYNAPITRAAQKRSHTIPIQGPPPHPPPHDAIISIHPLGPDGLSVDTNPLRRGPRRRRPARCFWSAPRGAAGAGRVPRL